MAINWTNITTPADLLKIPNDNSNGSFWVVSLYLVWIVLLIAFIPFGFESAILLSSFLALVASILLLYMDLINVGFMLFFLAIILFYIFYIVWSSYRDK